MDLLSILKTLDGFYTTTISGRPIMVHFNKYKNSYLTVPYNEKDFQKFVRLKEITDLDKFSETKGEEGFLFQDFKIEKLGGFKISRIKNI